MGKWKKPLISIALIAAAAVLVIQFQNCGSGDGNNNAPGSALAVSPSSTTIGLSTTIQLTASGGTSPYTYSVYTGSGYISSTGLFTSTSVSGTTTVIVKDSVGSTVYAYITVSTSSGGGGSGGGTVYTTTGDNPVVCCPTGTSATSWTDIGTGQNHGIYLNNPSTGCCTAWEGPKNYGAPGCQITCL